jgi:hypothetical protein
MLRRYFTLLLLLTAFQLVFAVTLSNDPTRPPNYRGESYGLTLNNIRLGSVLYSNTRKAALINGKLWALGDKTQNIELVKIDKNQVTLKDLNTGKEFTVSVFNHSIRQPVRE